MATFTNQTKSSAPTFTSQTKSAEPTFTNMTKRTGESISASSPIGLLLALTYAGDIAGATSWTNQTKS